MLKYRGGVWEYRLTTLLNKPNKIASHPGDREERVWETSFHELSVYPHYVCCRNRESMLSSCTSYRFVVRDTCDINPSDLAMISSRFGHMFMMRQKYVERPDSQRWEAHALSVCYLVIRAAGYSSYPSYLCCHFELCELSVLSTRAICAVKPFELSCYQAIRAMEPYEPYEPSSHPQYPWCPLDLVLGSRERENWMSVKAIT